MLSGMEVEKDMLKEQDKGTEYCAGEIYEIGL